MASYNRNNNFNKKYTFKSAKKIMLEALQIAVDHEEINFIGEVATLQGTYRHQYDLFIDYHDNKKQELATLKKRMKDIFEQRLAKRALKQEVNTTMAIFMLKNNHGWADKKEVDVTSQGEKIATNVYMIPVADEE